MTISHQYRHWLITIFLLTLGLLENKMPSHSFVSFYTDGIVFEFLMGVWIAFIYNRNLILFMVPKNIATITLCLASPLLLLFVEFNLQYKLSTYSGLFRALIAWTTSSIIVILLLSIETSFVSMQDKFKTNIMWLGDLSYSLYLVHAYVLVFIYRILYIHSMATYLIVSIPVILLAAHLSLSYIEKPSKNLLRRKLIKF